MTPEQVIPGELKLLLLRTLFRASPPPEALWAGLLTVDPGPSAPLADFEALEPEAPGYARVRLPSESWRVLPAPVRAESEGPTFKNGGTRAWPVVRFAFVATSEDGSGALVGLAPLRGPRTLIPGDTLTVPLRFEFE